MEKGDIVNKKNIVLLIILVTFISLAFLTITTEKSHEKNLIYEIALSKGNKSVKTQQIQMQVGDNWISTNIEGESYDVEIGNRVIKSDFEDPELLLILPNILRSPEEGHEEELGVNPVKIEGKHTSAEYTSNYELNGTRKCKFLGYKVVENELGEFNCSNIRCNTSYSLNMVVELENGTVHTTTNGTVLSKRLIDEDKQLLVHSQHEISKVVKTNLSNMYQKFGFEKMYREMPREQHVEINLIGLE